jgi:hypothetical protein
MRKADLPQRVRQCRLTGGVLPQAIRWSIPLVSGPQAAVWASRVASASEAADAVAVFSAPANATATVHSIRCELRVDQSRNAPKASKARRDSTLFREIIPGLAGTK